MVVVSVPWEKTVMFLNISFFRKAAVLSGLSDERTRGVLPRWQNSGRMKYLETPRF